MSKSPAFSIYISDKDITSVISEHLCSLTLTESSSFRADDLSIELDDSKGKLDLPPRGAIISLSLGWQTDLVYKGKFTVDEVSFQGPPDKIIINARSANFRGEMNYRREQSYNKQTIEQIISIIAGRYNLSKAISAELSNQLIDHIDQTGESDLSFLTRLADYVGAIATIKNNTLLFMRRGAAMTISGQPLPVITITRSLGDQISFSIADRDAYTGVKANYIDLNKQKNTTLRGFEYYNTRRNSGNRKSKPRSEYLTGTDENVKVLRRLYSTKREAEQAAINEFERLQRGTASLSMMLAYGDPNIMPESPVHVIGVKPQIDSTNWIVTKVTHDISTSGFTTALEFEIQLTDV